MNHAWYVTAVIKMFSLLFFLYFVSLDYFLLLRTAFSKGEERTEEARGNKYIELTGSINWSRARAQFLYLYSRDYIYVHVCMHMYIYTYVRVHLYTMYTHT